MLHVEVNGQPVDLHWDGKKEWKVLIEGIRADLHGRGWAIDEVTVNEQVIDDPDGAEIDLEVEEEQRVAITASPTREGLRKLHEDLVASLPRFRQAFTDLGQQFTRGDWRPALETLDPLLEELRLVAQGFDMLKTWERQGKSSVPQLAPILAQLSEGVQRQSWVEVSDLLLYELGPLLDTWEKVARSTYEERVSLRARLRCAQLPEAQAQQRS